MRWQKVYLKEDVTLVTDTDLSIPVPRINPISGFIIIFEITGGGSSTMAAADEASVELIKDGHEVITSVQWGELVGIDNFLMPAAYAIADIASAASGKQEAFIPLGRFLGDGEYFLDPRGFNALDLKIHTPDIVTGGTPTYSVILVRGYPPEAAPLGYFKLSTKKAYTAEAAIEYITLDRAYKYGLLALSEIDNTSVDISSAVLGLLRLNVDAGAFYPIDLDARDLLLAGRMIYPDPDITDLGTPLADSNMVICQWMKPWLGEEGLLPAPDYGSLVLEATGKAAGEVRVTGMELVK